MYVGPDGSGDRDKCTSTPHPAGVEEGTLDGLGNDIKFAMAKASYNFRNSVKQWMSEILHVLLKLLPLPQYDPAFYLIVLAILGPLIFGISVFDGLQHT